MSLLLLFGSPSVSGTAALTVPEPALAAAGTLEFTGTAALTAAEPTISATGAETFSGSAALAVAEPTVAATGEQTFSGSAARTTPEPTLAAAGSLEFSGSAALTIGQPSIAATGISPYRAISLATDFTVSPDTTFWASQRGLSVPTAAAGKITIDSGRFGNSTDDLTAEHTYILPGDRVFWDLSGYSLGGTVDLGYDVNLIVQTIGGDGLIADSFTLGIERSAVDGLDYLFAQISPNSSVQIGLYDPVAHRFLAVRQDGTTGYLETSPDGSNWTVVQSAALNSPDAWLQNALVQAFVEDPGGVAYSTLTLNAFCVLEPTGTADLAVSELAISAAAVLEFASSADLSVATPAVAAVGTETFSGSAALDVAAPDLAANAALTFTGTTSLDASAPGLSATGSLTFVGSAALSAPEPTLDASGIYTPLAISGAAALQIATPASAAAGVEVFVAGCAEYGSAVYGQSTFGCTGNTNLTVRTPIIGASGLVLAEGDVAGTAALSVPEPTISASGSETFVAGCAEYGTAVYGQSTFGCTGNTNLDVPEPTISAAGTVTLPASATTSGGGGGGRVAYPIDLRRYTRQPPPKPVPPAITGTCSARVAAPRLSSDATYTALAITGAISLDAPQPKVVADARLGFTARAALEIPTPAVDCIAELGFTSTAALGLSAPAAAAYGSHEDQDEWLLAVLADADEAVALYLLTT